MSPSDPPRPEPHTVLSRAVVSRRCALLGLGGAGAAAVLAACSGGSVRTGATSSAAGRTATSSTATATATAPTSASPTTGSTSAGTAAGGIAALSDVPVGGTATVTVDGQGVLLSQPTAGTVEAFSNVCPHQGGTVVPNGAGFVCTRHRSEFTGAGVVTKGPAQSDLTAIAVAVSGTEIVKA